MKKNSLILIILAAVPIVLTVLVIDSLPDIVPVHYNFSGDIDRWGSRYELLVFPIATVVMMLFFLLINRYHYKTGDERNIKNTFRISALTLVLFNVMTIIGLTTISVDATGKTLPFSLPGMRLLFILTGVFFIPLGQWIPKIQRNSFMGLRTKWSLMNDENWFKAQRAGRGLLIVYGLLLITANLLISQQQLANFVSFGLLLSMLPSYLVLNHFLSKQSNPIK